MHAELTHYFNVMANIRFIPPILVKKPFLVFILPWHLVIWKKRKTFKWSKVSCKWWGKGGN